MTNTKKPKVVLIDPNDTLRFIVETQLRLARVETQSFTNYQDAMHGLAILTKPYPDTILVSTDTSPEVPHIVAAIEAMLPTAKLVVMMPKDESISSEVYRITNAYIVYKPFRVQQLHQYIGVMP